MEPFSALSLGCVYLHGTSNSSHPFKGQQSPRCCSAFHMTWGRTRGRVTPGHEFWPLRRGRGDGNGLGTYSLRATSCLP